MTPAANFNDRLGGYVEVKERIRLFYEAHPEGRLTTHSAEMTADPDGNVRVWVHARAYRTPDDPLPADGWSYLAVPGTTPYTRGSEVENAETSAWGRAIGALGIGIDKSIASRNEVQAKEGEFDRPATTRREPDAPQTSPDGGLIGTVAIGNAWLDDCEVRSTPAGPVIGFRLKSGRQSQKVQARGPMALALGGMGTDLIGQTVTCWGQLTGEEFTPSGSTRPVAYQVLRLERVHGAEFDIPARDAAPGAVEASGGLLCASRSPWEGSAPCTLADGHAGNHRSSEKETW